MFICFIMLCNLLVYYCCVTLKSYHAHGMIYIKILLNYFGITYIQFFVLFMVHEIDRKDFKIIRVLSKDIIWYVAISNLGGIAKNQN